MSESEVPQEYLTVSRRSMLRAELKEPVATSKVGLYSHEALTVEEFTGIANAINEYWSRPDFPPEYRAVFRECMRRELSLDFVGEPSKPYILDITAVPTTVGAMRSVLQLTAQEVRNWVANQNDFLIQRDSINGEVRDDMLGQNSHFFHDACAHLSGLADDLERSKLMRQHKPLKSRFQVSPAKQETLTMATLVHVAERWSGYHNLLAEDPRFRTIVGHALEHELGLQFTPPPLDSEEIFAASSRGEQLRGFEHAAHGSSLTQIPKTIAELEEMQNSLYATVRQRVDNRIEELKSDTSIDDQSREYLIAANRKFKGDVKILGGVVAKEVDAMQIAEPNSSAARGM